jgi:uncharacterized protein
METVMTPRELFDRMSQDWLGHPRPLTGALFTDDVIIEMPFAGFRIQGRQEFLDFADPQRAALPVHFDRVDVRAVHETLDPGTIIIEYALTGTATHTGRQATAPFVAVLTARDGRISHWREYQDHAAVRAALA